MDSQSALLYRRCTPVVDVVYQCESDETAIEAVIDAVATAANADPLSLPSLYDVIDPDVLTHLLTPGGGDSGTTVSFSLDHWTVFVRGDGRIRVCDQTVQRGVEPVFEATDTVSS